MGPLDALWHLLNLFTVPVALGLLAPALAKLLWRQALRSTPWWLLARRCVAVGMGLTLAGLVVLGQDGRMLTYLSLVLGCALTLWWTGLRRH